MPVTTLKQAAIVDPIEPDEWEHRITTSAHSCGHFTPDTMALQISIWGLPLALTSPSCVMAESFPGGSELMEAMTPEFDDGDYLASEGPGFGTRLTEAMVLDHVLRP